MSQSYRNYRTEDQRTLATWAADCAERVLPHYAQAFPGDDRPKQAIAACREWVRAGQFSMTAIRGASLAAHAAARQDAGGDAAKFAARAAGQAVATAHVPQHAYGAAYYALKAVAAVDPENAEANIAREYSWQSERLPEHLRVEFMPRIIVRTNTRGIRITIRKGAGF